MYDLLPSRTLHEAGTLYCTDLSASLVSCERLRDPKGEALSMSIPDNYRDSFSVPLRSVPVSISMAWLLHFLFDVVSHLSKSVCDRSIAPLLCPSTYGESLGLPTLGVDVGMDIYAYLHFSTFHYVSSRLFFHDLVT